MSKHTAGPWAAGLDKVGPVSQEDDQSYGIMMPVAYIERFDYPDQFAANASLISAAPDLLEALSEIINDGGKFVMTQETHRKARAAIAKSRGEV